MFSRYPEQKSIFTISPNIPFVDTLARAVFDHSDAEMISLFDYTILLPTRRAVRSLKEGFLRVTDKEALLLPKMIPLGDLDEDELEIGSIEDTNFSNDGQIPDAISSIHRQLLLAQMVQAFKSDKLPFDQSVQLAGELGRLLDQVQTEQLSFENLNLLVPETLSEHWQMTLRFLKIITDQWPHILNELNLIDPADRRNRLLAAQRRFWERIPPRGPVIAAGSTGSIPATAELLDFVASLPNGCVVLPGLDQSLSQSEIFALLPTHPQYGMHQLLSAMEVKADKVLDLYTPPNKAKNLSHSELINVALRPEISDQDKKHIGSLLDGKFEGIEYVECSTPDEESSVIALMMRKIAEEKDQTAALITPDRDLARRVTSKLKRWDIRVNDSAGQLLENCPPGIFLRLTSKLITDNFRPIDLLAVCKHPIAACGFSPKKLRNLIRKLEITVLRGPRPGPGLRGITSLLSEPDDELHQLLDRIGEYSNEFAKLVKGESAPLEKILEAHVGFAEAFAASDEQTGRERLWSGEFGEAVFEFVFELLNKAQMMGSFACREYSGFLKIMMSGHMVRPNYSTHPRLQIWGLLEARLQKADLLILGGLNEGTWPPEPRGDPWMSRSMRSKFGLPPYERRVGLTAHDFTQAFSAPRVALTRSQTVDGTPRVPARWLLRLFRLVGARKNREILNSKQPWRQWQALLNKPNKNIPFDPPAPKPPVSARPRELSVTQIEMWMRDPYSIYAQHVLKLKPLPKLDMLPDPAEFGILIHRILEGFAGKFPLEHYQILPDDAEEKLVALGEEEFSQLKHYPSIWAFWWPRFKRIATWFVIKEREERINLADIRTEVRGSITIEGPAGPFIIRAVADRIDTLLSGKVRIIDYKTGVIPSKREVMAGYAPQLPLEAAILSFGGFREINKVEVGSLDYWRLTGTFPVGSLYSLGDDPSLLAQEALKGVRGLVETFDCSSTPYQAQPRSELAPKYSDYEHLARLKEWGTGPSLLEEG